MNARGMSDQTIEALKTAYARRGRHGYCEKELALMLEVARQRRVEPYFVARMYARLGDNDRALEWLEKAYDEHADHLVLLKVDPLLDELRGDARFDALMKRVGFGS